MRTLPALAVLFALTVTGCTDDGDDAVGEGADELAGALAGHRHWVSEGCEPFANPDGTFVYKTREYAFERGTWSSVVTIYGPDAACTSPIFSLTGGGDYELRGPSATVERARNVFFGFNARAITPSSPEAAQALNGGGVCGHHDWAAGVAVDVNDPGCLELNMPPLAACPGEHDLIALRGRALYLGGRTTDSLDNACQQDNHPTQTLEFALVRP